MHYPRNLSTLVKAMLGAIGMIVFLVMVYRLPPVERRLGWRFDALATSLRTTFKPVGQMPTPAEKPAVTRLPTSTHQPTRPAPTRSNTRAAGQAGEPTLAPTLTPTGIPPGVKLDYPHFNDAQDWNNCGPATLALYLRYYGWEGDQFTVSDQIKPLRADRNVNIDELLGYVYANINWLYAEFRVGGNLDLLRQVLATGTPVMIEESFWLDEDYWSNDDRWAGHYLLLTGYDDATQTFIAQDSFRGPNRRVGYADLDKAWQSFNRVYFLLYRPELKEQLQAIVGEDWDYSANRQNALETARQETESDPQNPFGWFNLGTNLLYFERYDEAAEAFDTARQLRLPQRMLRYQFGPFLAYFHAGRNEDLLALSEYALGVTPNSEEALLWRGWALYRAGDAAGALKQFNLALEARPGYSDASYAIDFVTQN